MNELIETRTITVAKLNFCTAKRFGPLVDTWKNLYLQEILLEINYEKCIVVGKVSFAHEFKKDLPKTEMLDLFKESPIFIQKGFTMHSQSFLEKKDHKTVIMFAGKFCPDNCVVSNINLFNLILTVSQLLIKNFDINKFSPKIFYRKDFFYNGVWESESDYLKKMLLGHST